MFIIMILSEDSFLNERELWLWESVYPEQTRVCQKQLLEYINRKKQ